VETDPAVAQAYAAWDADACTPEAANVVAQAIKALLDSWLDSHPSIKYLVVVGGDNIIPFWRVPDILAIADESHYRLRAGVARETPLYYALTEAYILSDDAYADRVPFAWFGRHLYLPDYPIGRLVETPQEIVMLIDAYLANGGHVGADTGLVVGYDFLTDSSLEIEGTLQGQGIATTSLISDAWSADELRENLLVTRQDLNSLNAHFEHWQASPADLGSGRLTSTDVAAASANLSGAVLFSVGCHAGLSVPDAWDNTGHALDFAQALASQGAIWVGNTGYGYGMSDAVALSERLMSLFVEELGRSSNVAVGEALIQAKRRYINGAAAASLSLYDEKVAIEATLFGLPMFMVSVPMPGGAVSPPNSSQAFDVASKVRAAEGLIARSVTITPTFSEVSTAQGRYFTVAGQVQANGGRPIQPLLSLDIARPVLVPVVYCFSKDATWTSKASIP